MTTSGVRFKKVRVLYVEHICRIQGGSPILSIKFYTSPCVLQMIGHYNATSWAWTLVLLFIYWRK